MELDLGTHYGESRTVQLGYQCAVHSHKEWVPTNEHHVWPKGLGGPNTTGNKIKVCMNGHGAIHAYLDLLIKHDGYVPTDLSRHFGLKVRQFAFQGWEEAGRPTTGAGKE